MRDCSSGDGTGFVSPKSTEGLAPAQFGRAISRAGMMHQAFAALSRLAPTELTVTLVGETGTGKDILAQALHERSARAEGPFVVFDCGAVAQTLAESELFGYERGAFTGAATARAGAFERAHGGTLFLDEIGELPLQLQPRLLRALENRSVQRVGGKRYRPVDLRIVAATHRDLSTMVAEKVFREDLFFRLAAAVIPVPPLRQRLEDLTLLVAALLADIGQSALQVSAETYAVLRAHDWPGNVRELKNALASASAFVDGPVLEPRHLLFLAPSAPARLDELRLGGQTLASLERVAITQTLLRHGGDKLETAHSLGISLTALLEKLAELSRDG